MRELCVSSSRLCASDLRDRFALDGCLYIRGLVDVDQVNRLAADVLEILHDQRLLDRCDDGVEAFRQTRVSRARAVQRLESFHALAHDPQLHRIQRTLVGEDAFVHPQRVLRAIPPGIPELVTPPHQDFAYIRGTRNTVTAWTPLRTCRTCDGALRVLVGSHRRGDLPLVGSPTLAGARVEVDDTDPDWASVEFEPGDVMLFHSLTIHEAMPNTSTRVRLSADYRFQSASEPVGERSLRPFLYPQVADWPELLADVAWDPRRWLCVPADLEVVSSDRG